jgi:hypothetical protein
MTFSNFRQQNEAGKCAGINKTGVYAKGAAARGLFVRYPPATRNRMLAALNAWSLRIAMKSKLLLVAATLAACITVLNAADEKALLGRIMWSAFQCSAFAELAENKNEQERLYLVGLNAGRTFLEAMKAGQISEQAVKAEVPINVLQRLEGPSNEFVIGKIHAAATGHAYDEIVKRKTGIWGPTQKQEARSAYTNKNCVLIR